MSSNAITRPASRLVLALGNDILGDDAAALIAAEILRKDFAGRIDFVDTIESGLALLELMTGYDQVLLLDTITTGFHKPGTILDFSSQDFGSVMGSSPHCMGLPEVFELANRLSIPFPREILIHAMEIDSPEEFSETLNPVIECAMDPYIRSASQILTSWIGMDASNESRQEVTVPSQLNKLGQFDRQEL